MKFKIILVLLVFLPWMGATAQSIFWSEEFTTGEGWQMDSNWGVNNDKLQFIWAPQVNNFDLSALSPVIALDAYVTDMVVNQFVDIYNGSDDEFAEISLILPTDTAVLWSHPLSNGNWGYYFGEDLVLPIQDYAGMEVRILIRTFGETTFNWNEWDVFYIHILASYEYDLAVTNLSGPAALEIQQSGTWTIDVTNFGSEALSGYTVNLYENRSNNLLGSVLETETIDPGETRFYDITWSSGEVFNTSLKAIVSQPDDQFVKNNKSRSKFLRIKPAGVINVLMWDHDNGIPDIICPEHGDLIDGSTGMKRVLDDAGIDYNLVSSLPANLNTYDIVFSTMGNYCLS